MLYSVLQGVAVCCNVLQCAAVRCSVSQCVTVCRSVLQCAVCCSVGLLTKGWAHPNFVELWSVSRLRLAEMAIEIWVMCRLKEKLFETSSVRQNLQVRIFVQILGDTSISEISESENGKRPALSRKRSDILNIWQ